MIKIYIACLSSYNNGFLFGKWFDLDKYSDADDLLDDIKKEVLDSPKNPSRVKYGEEPEEWAMHDIEGIDYDMIGTEYPDLEELVELNEVLSSEDGDVKIAFYKHYNHSSIKEALDDFEDRHYGKFDSMRDFAEYYAEEINGWDLSSGMGLYFDSEAFARDLETEFTEIDGHIFSDR